MGKYLSPPDPLKYGTKCAIVFYPDDDGVFYLDALKGQLSQLAKPFMWEGEFAKQIAQIWLQHDRMTEGVFFGLDCEDIPFIVGEETMNINVNVDCCGGCGGGNTLICYDMDGNPVIAPAPYNPEISPPGGSWPIDTQAYPPPGDTFPTWTEFDENACLVANGIWKLSVYFASALETFTDQLAILATILVLLAGWLPSGIAAAIGVASLTDIVVALIEILSFEQATDWLNDLKAWLETNQSIVVCEMYALRYDIPAAAISFEARVMAEVFEAYGLDGQQDYLVRRLVRSLIPIDYVWDALLGSTKIVVATPTIDCVACASAGQSFDYAEPFDLSIEGTTLWERDGNPPLSWRVDNGGEVYSIGSVTERGFGWTERGLTALVGVDINTVLNVYISEVRFTLARNVAQAPESNPFVRWNYADGTSADGVGVSTDASYNEYAWANPNPEKPVIRTSIWPPFFSLILPGVPGASTWYEYFVSAARVVGRYTLL